MSSDTYFHDKDEELWTDEILTELDRREHEVIFILSCLGAWTGNDQSGASRSEVTETMPDDDYTKQMARRDLDQLVDAGVAQEKTGEGPQEPNRYLLRWEDDRAPVQRVPGEPNELGFIKDVDHATLKILLTTSIESRIAQRRADQFSEDIEVLREHSDILREMNAEAEDEWFEMLNAAAKAAWDVSLESKQTKRAMVEICIRQGWEVEEVLSSYSERPDGKKRWAEQPPDEQPPEYN
ncbi:hypothetical protein RYH80_19945 [Halobaculum sp. MBLA0147]|uniref:hypothetical protein n=1 Tax=Halobaculum sp. MBLA0147 TaxID=3079934 RepID=UPI003525502D